MTRTIETYVSTAADAFEAGFQSKAAQKRSLEALNRAYSMIRDEVFNAVLAVANAKWPEYCDERSNHFDKYDVLPFDLHQVRDRHFEAVAEFPVFIQVRDLIALRAEIKAAPIVEKVADVQAERVETIRRTIVEEIEMRKAQFVEGMEVARLFNGLPVSVNAHLVHGHKGAVFVRHFFYLRGKLTPLNMILGIADAFMREKEGKAA